MELTPREKDKLLLFTAGLLAERRKARGLKLNYPDHPSLVDGQFVPQVSESDNRSWLSKATLGLI